MKHEDPSRIRAAPREHGQTEAAQQPKRGAAVCAAVRAGRVSREGERESWCRPIAHAGDILSMVTTRGKAVARRSVGTQTEVPRKNTGVQVSGCRECLSLALVPEDSRDSSCVRCEQVNDLLSLMAEPKEQVERLRSVRECEREIDWWSSTLPSLRQRQQEAAP